ncbi:IclR family transcriptional regulator [Haladaptatus sp. ZSTT2]|uniref:IclR family transcriptional regulator n=1 Tax=Haladaptatus sp. ZSTT2 TaxID=3120515 RepID=UPI00300EBFE3
MVQNSPDGGPRTIAAVEKACAIVDSLHEMNGATLTEVADHLDLTPGTVYPHLATLMQQELVIKQDDHYYTGYRFLTIGETRRRNDVLFEHAMDEIDEFAQEANVRMQIYIEEFGRAVCIGIAGGKRSISPVDEVGYRTPLHCIAAGKAMLAEFDQDQLDEHISRHGLSEHTENTITNRDRLVAELKEISDQGYAVNDEEYIPRLRAVGAAVTKEDGSILGAISASAPVGVLSGRRLSEELPKQIVAMAHTIEMNIRVQSE